MPLDLWKVEIIIAKPSLQRTFVVVAWLSILIWLVVEIYTVKYFHFRYNLQLLVRGFCCFIPFVHCWIETILVFVKTTPIEIWLVVELLRLVISLPFLYDMPNFVERLFGFFKVIWNIKWIPIGKLLFVYQILYVHVFHLLRLRLVDYFAHPFHQMGAREI
jgi:hypothetical protein